ncbi:MAG: 4-hydroxy-tetrahydrodipicolinate synthase [Bacteroidetes bacterium]|nr:4-hydroxy-tetrahydrodipicolinate synthase [Bacteroidota bacterium]
MNVDFLRGTGVALVTPFDEHLNIDYTAHQKIIDHVIEGGVDYLVVIGTTGESVNLSPEEKQELIRKTIHFAHGRVPVVAGFGGNNTRQVVKDLGHYNLTGVDAILSVSPSYNKPTQDGIYAHFKEVASATHLPIVLYNVPGRTSSNMEASTTLRLANDFENIVAIKEASYDLEQITQLARNKPEGFILLSGCDDLIFHEMALGFDGVISVVGNVIPEVFTRMIALCREDRFLEAGEIQKGLYDFIFLIFAEGNPAGAKCALKHLGLCEEHIRLPLVQVNNELREQIGQALAKVK